VGTSETLWRIEMRRAEGEALNKQIAKAILSNDNTLTSPQLQMRFPRATSTRICQVANSLGLQLPHSEYLEDWEMEPFTESQADCIERIKKKYWRRGNPHTTSWTDRWIDKGME